MNIVLRITMEPTSWSVRVDLDLGPVRLSFR